MGRAGFEPTKTYVSRFTVCPSWPLWYLPNFHLLKQTVVYLLQRTWADRGSRTHDLLITNQLLWPTELHRRNNPKWSAKVWINFQTPNNPLLFFNYLFKNHLNRDWFSPPSSNQGRISTNYGVTKLYNLFYINKFHEKRIIIFPAFSLPAYQIFILFTDTDQSYNTQKPWYLHNFQNKIAIPAFRPSEQRCQ